MNEPAAIPKSEDTKNIEKDMEILAIHIQHRATTPKLDTTTHKGNEWNSHQGIVCRQIGEDMTP